MLTASLIMWLAAGTHPTNAFDLPLAPARFAWSSPLAQRNDLYAVKGTPDGSHIWAVGAAGTVLSLRGANAALEATGTDQDLYDVWVVAKDDVWIVGERGTILHGNGKTWSRVPSGTTQALFSIWGRNAEDLWIGGGSGTVLHREGKTFRVVPTPTKGPISSLVGCENAEVCALTLAGQLPNVDTSNRPCDDPGWCQADEPQEPEGDRILRWSGGRWLADSCGPGPQSRLVVAAGSKFWATEDGGISVFRNGKCEQGVRLPRDTETEMVHMDGAWARSETDGWLVGTSCTREEPGWDYRCDRGAIWRFNGRKASRRKEVPATPLLAVWAWSAKGAIAVGERGTVVRFDGERWTPVNKPVTDVDLRGVLSIPASPSAATRGAVTLRARENENEPRPRTVELVLAEGGTTPWGLLKQVGPAPERTHDDADTWLIADCEALRARGQSWITYFPPECVPYAATRKIVGSGAGDAWIAPGISGSSASSLPLQWNGPVKTNVRAPASGLVDLWASKSDDVWFVGGRAILHWNGRALTAVPPGPWLETFAELTSVWGSDAGDVWIAAHGSNGVKVARWDGTIWQAVASFQFNWPRRMQSDDPGVNPTARPWPFRDSWQVALWGTSASDVWLAGPNGVVLRFDGRRWQRVATPTRHPLFGLGGTRDHVLAVGAIGTILELDRR